MKMLLVAEATMAYKVCAAQCVTTSSSLHSLLTLVAGYILFRPGTPQWMAPEVLEGQRYNGKVDVYSFGVVLCEIFSRILPYSDRWAASPPF